MTTSELWAEILVKYQDALNTMSLSREVMSFYGELLGMYRANPPACENEKRRREEAAANYAKLVNDYDVLVRELDAIRIMARERLGFEIEEMIRPPGTAVH